ncbi:MAG: acyl carrier protein [Nitrososphaeria archaeon]|nr:acyl carrier protein [Candidatus Bathyarchaeota archaeon]
MKSVEERVKEIISQVFNVRVEDLKDDTNFVIDLRAKSADIVELLALLEDEFKIEIPLAEAIRNRTVGDAWKYVERKISSK